MAGAGHRSLRAVQRRAIHSPGLSRHHRHAADAVPGQGIPGRQGPEQARQAGRRLAGNAGIQLLLRQSLGRRSPRQARQPGQTGRSARSPSITGSATALPPTSRMTNSPARSWRPSATKARARPSSGIAICRSPNSSSMTLASSSWACAWPVPSAITTPTKSGARTITGAWPRSSLRSAARMCRLPACRAATGQTHNRFAIFNKGTGTVTNTRTQQAGGHACSGRRAGQAELR